MEVAASGQCVASWGIIWGIWVIVSREFRQVHRDRRSLRRQAWLTSYLTGAELPAENFT
ncbi:hypothetical protein SAMN05443245_3586 [Paraburkholderia fungorum]|uniref:Uncharacterized protein n=1 Tax=Paraburkholderia fungorum TaxID=134537 RepID=A0A1H1H7R6_9BURK|nr:hypothetical protein SAMN05443245_3586 [Paraburkholderia fungorum]